MFRSTLWALAALVAATFLIGSGSQAAAQWVPCAREGGFCQVPYPTIVRYGAQGYFTDRRVGGGGIGCNNRVFGDPIEGLPKTCFYRAREQMFEPEFGYEAAPVRPRPRAWQFCAREGGVCRFSGVALVRYGAEGVFVTREVRGGVSCRNEVFGDPTPGIPKQCHVLF